MRTSALLLALNFGSAALAFPAYKRQADPTTIESRVLDIDTSTLVITPSATEDSPFPSASATGSADVDYSSYPCPEGYLLTYQEAQRTYETSYITLRDANLMAGSWSRGPQYTDVSSGSEDDTDETNPMVDEPGTMRSSETDLFNETIDETLVDSSTSSEAYQAVSNLTSILTLTGGDLVITNWTYVYQAYSNNTGTEAEAPRSTIKLFANACASDQPAAREAMALLFQQSFDNIATQVASADSSFTATRTFVATIAPPVVTDTAFATRTEQNTETEVSTATLVEQETNTETATETNTETNTATQTLVNDVTNTATVTNVNTATETSVLLSVVTSVSVSVNPVTETQLATETLTPEISQITTAVAVPTVVIPTAA